MIIPILLDDPFGRSYLKKVLQVEPANLIGLWLQNEASGDVSYDRSGNDHHGAYTGVTLGQTGVLGMGYTCPLFDGVTSYNNIYSAELAPAISGAEGTIIIPAKVYNAAVWGDETTRRIINFYVDGDNRLYISRSATDGTILFLYESGNAVKTVIVGSLSSVAFVPYGLTWSKADDEVITYINGAQTGSTQTGLGTWVGSPASASTCIGAYGTGATYPWHGWIGPVSLWTKALTPAQMAYLSKA